MNVRITIKKLLDYCQRVDIQALANLPPPDTFFTKHSASNVQKVAMHLLAVWRHIILSKEDDWRDLEVHVTWTGTPTHYRAGEAVAWVLFVITFHYHQAVMVLFDRVSVDPQSPPPPMNQNLLEEIKGSVLEDGDGILDSAKRFAFNYFCCLWGSFLLCLMHCTGVRNSQVNILEEVTHYAAFRLVDDLKNRDEDGLRWDLKWLLTYGSFEALSLAYSISANHVGSREKGIGYSDLNIHELPSLANRDEFAREIYGEKGIEREFELQLSILMQSFGFYVVPASPGEKSVDLICIPSSTPEAGVLMLDAKSSKYPYKLPASDSRALEEYYRHVSQTVTTIPRVTDLLIVGGDASRSLPKRLRELEVRLQINVRFCHAEHLGRLRGRLTGNLQPHEFFRVIRESSYVIRAEDLEMLVHSEQSRSEALSRLVKTFMGSNVRIR